MSSDQSPQPVISVVISTYNRARLLEQLLAGLYESTAPGSSWEIVVVDNNSSDETESVVRQFGRSRQDLRYCFEPRQGISAARNRGWREARGEYVAFFDDDCRVPTPWIETALEIIMQTRPAAMGGPFSPLYGFAKPLWFKDAYVSHDLGPLRREMEDSEYLGGTNIAVRRSLLEELGGFDERLGMRGGELGYGEEIDLQRRLRRDQPDGTIIYDPRLLVWNIVFERQTRLSFALRQFFVGGRYTYYAFRETAPPGFARRAFRTARLLVVLVARLVTGLAFRDRSRFSQVQNFVYEEIMPQIGRLGFIYEEWMSKLSVRGRP